MAKELETEREEGFNLKDYGMLFLAHWYWFVASVIVAVCIAAYYILSTTPIYTSSTQLLIRDNENGKASSAVQDFKDLGLISSKTNINNEILTISAPILMQEVAERLHLDLQMQVDEGLHVRPLYNDAPITLNVSAPLGDGYAFSMVLTPLSQTKAELKEFWTSTDEAENKTVMTVDFGKTVKTPVGNLKVDRSPSWSDDYIGRPITINKYPVAAVGNLYASRLSVALSDKDATVLNLTITDEVPDRASDVLLTLVDVYNEKWVKDKNRMAESTSEFITERLEALTKELDDVDEQISDYKSTNLLPSVEASLAKDMQQSSKNLESLLELTNQLSMAQYLRERLSDESKTDQLLPSSMGLTSGGLESLISEYNKLMLNRISYVENSNENAPVVRDIDRRLASQKTAIIRSVDNLVEQLRKQIANVEANDATITSQIADNPKQAKILTSVQRQQKVKEALYIFLLQKREENELSRTYTAWNTSIIQPPVGSQGPTSPRKSMIMLMALMLGLAVPGGILFLRETMNNKVRGRRDLDNLDIPLIGEIPQITTKKHWWSRNRVVPRKIVIEKGSKDLINESMRIVRTNLDYFVPNHDAANVVMFTSFNPGSGKSFISANLSKAVSLKGKRVIAVDMDLRHCSLSHYFVHAHNESGLSAYLSGQTTSIDDIIMTDALGEGLDLIPAGIIPPNPTELLLGETMDTLFEELRKRYDFIFLDCPPIEIVADASIIKKYADVSIFVVRAGLMDRHALKDVETLYKEKKYNRLAIMLNGTTYVSSKYGNYRYGYSYGYSYNYDGGYYNQKN